MCMRFVCLLTTRPFSQVRWWPHGRSGSRRLDLQVGLIDEPPVTRSVTARPGSLNKLRAAALTGPTPAVPGSNANSSTGHRAKPGPCPSILNLSRCFAPTLSSTAPGHRTACSSVRVAAHLLTARTWLSSTRHAAQRSVAPKPPRSSPGAPTISATPPSRHCACRESRPRL